ncbi:T9SS type A sorting domain-containing protein [Ichthyenterobacterium sp. W332]|uniref:T9SS type A sorting domain-containing protein n=1 Tax=Microcosmobacter mediterraneus TaxID=3075607 RepID=A0ABU2YMF7_9FLAO|nr:T9SS type A sorting domain-containing protein [Ichthyenterobacterium sp. W332]MDT0558460.1 T9SS type A sorting domain-containing protein [Ichthyenterobacterium sp. W332]
MKKNYILSFLLALAFLPMQAQVTVTVDPDATWVGFMSVTNLPAPQGDGAFQFDSGWGVPDLVAEVNAGSDITLKPNRINDSNIYWNSPGELRGNKYMSASSFVEENDNMALTGQEITFTGDITAFTLNSTGIDVPFTVEAFVKKFAAGFVLLEEVYTTITGTGTFSVTSTDTNPDGIIIQYGFLVRGANINIDAAFNTDYDNLGSVVAEPFPLSNEEFDTSEFNVSPNPTKNTWNIESNQVIIGVEVFDILGKRVMNLKPNTEEVNLDASQLINGVYFARIESVNGTKTMKLVKN